MFTQHFAQRTRQQRRMCSSHRLAIRLFYFCFSRENFVCATFSMATTTVLAVGERVAYTCRTTYVSCSIACCSTRCVCMSVAFHSGHFRSCCMCACARPQMLALRFQFCSVPFVVQSSTMSTHLLPKATTLTSWAITSIRFLFAQTISRWLLFCWPTHSFRPLNSYLLFRFFLHPQRIETHSNSETRESTFTSFAVFRFVSLRVCVCVCFSTPPVSNFCVWSRGTHNILKLDCVRPNANDERNEKYILSIIQKPIWKKCSRKNYYFPVDVSKCQRIQRDTWPKKKYEHESMIIAPFMIARLDLCRSHFNYLFIRHKCGLFGEVSKLNWQ